MGRHVAPEDHLAGRRAILFDAITEEPGIHYKAILRKTGIQSGTVRHHLSMLERFGYVHSIRSGPNLRYVPAGHDPSDYSEAAVYARDPVNREILDLVQEHPGAYQRQLTDWHGGLPRSTMAYRLHRLADLDLLEQSNGHARERRYWMPGEGGRVPR